LPARIKEDANIATGRVNVACNRAARIDDRRGQVDTVTHETRLVAGGGMRGARSGKS